MAKKKAPKRWVFVPPKPVKPAIPEDTKEQVAARCQAFMEQMKPRWVEPPKEEWGYVSDVYGRWYHNYYHFCALYRYESAKASTSEREVKFARLEYTGPNSFRLSYYRHTGAWWELFEDLGLEQCLEQVEHNPLLHP